MNEAPPPYQKEQPRPQPQPIFVRKSLPEYPKEQKRKIRTIIPFPFYDIDITDFPKIKFIKNSVSDGICYVI